jgi:MFS family permease
MKIGAKRVFIFSVILTSSTTMGMAALYFVHDIQFIIAVILRLITGFGYSPVFRSAYTFWAIWAVPAERSTLTSIGFCSMHVGTGKSTFFFVTDNFIFSLSCNDVNWWSLLSLY